MIRYITRFVLVLCVFGGFATCASAQESVQILRMRVAPLYFNDKQSDKEFWRARDGQVDPQLCDARAANFPWDAAVKGLHVMGYDIHQLVPLREEVMLFGGVHCLFSLLFVYRMETDIDSLPPEKLALQEFFVGVPVPAVHEPVVAQQPPPEVAPAPVVVPPPAPQSPEPAPPPAVVSQPLPPLQPLQPAPVLHEELPAVKPLQWVPLPRPRPRDLGLVRPSVKKIQNTAPVPWWNHLVHPANP